MEDKRNKFSNKKRKTDLKWNENYSQTMYACYVVDNNYIYYIKLPISNYYVQPKIR